MGIIRGGLKAGRTATVVVAASDSLTKSRAQADYRCDGANDEVEIQAAIDALPGTTATTPSGTVVLLAGNYYLSDSVRLRRNGLRIVGEGSYNTKIWLADNKDCHMFYGVPDQGFYFLTIEHLYMNGNNSNNSGDIDCINADGYRDVYIHDCFIEYAARRGISIASDNARITNCVIQHCTDSGIFGETGGDLKILGGKVALNTGNGITLQKMPISSIIGVGVHSNGKYGLDIQGAGETPESLSIIGCQFKDNSKNNSDTYDDIRIYKAPQRTKIIGCGFVAGDDVRKAINIASSTAVEAFISGNTFQGYSGNPIEDSGTSSRIYSQFSEHFQDLQAKATDYVHSGITGTGAEQEITTNITNPDVPRNISVTVTNNASPSGDVTITGTDAQGNSITEDITLVPGGTAYGNKAFATISKITVPATVNGGGADTVTVGIGDKLGLLNVIYATSDVYKIKVNNADKTSEFDMATDVDTENSTVDMSSLAAGGITAGDDITIYYRSNLNIIS